MGHRQEASDKLLHEMHAMVCNQRQGVGTAETGPMVFPVAAPSAAASHPEQVPGGNLEVPATPTVGQLTGDGDMGQASGGVIGCRMRLSRRLQLEFRRLLR